MLHIMTDKLSNFPWDVVTNKKTFLFLIISGLLCYLCFWLYENNHTTVNRKSKNFKHYLFSTRFNMSLPVKPHYIYTSRITDNLDDNLIKGIPKIIHQTYKGDKVPVLFKPWMQSWLRYNPAWQHWFWTDEDIRQLIATTYPNFIHHFDNYKKNISRADMFRYFVMYEYGGIYADLDVECLKSLDTKMTEHDCIVTQEPLEHVIFDKTYNRNILISNAFLACIQRHPFYKHVIDNVLKYYAFSEVLHQTGPIMLTSAFRTFRPKKHLPYMAKTQVYQPKIDPGKVTAYQQKCKMWNQNNHYISNTLKNLCEKLLLPTYANEPTNVSYTVHHWTHMWLENNSYYRKESSSFNKTFNMEDLFH